MGATAHHLDAVRGRQYSMLAGMDIAPVTRLNFYSASSSMVIGIHPHSLGGSGYSDLLESLPGLSVAVLLAHFPIRPVSIMNTYYNSCIYWRSRQVFTLRASWIASRSGVRSIKQLQDLSAVQGWMTLVRLVSQASICLLSTVGVHPPANGHGQHNIPLTSHAV